VLREELRRVSGWQAHHRRLIGRLLLILVATLVIDVVGTFLVYLAERHARGTDIHSVGDAFFFTTVQLLTVSSQIRNPLTPFGRVVDIVLEVWAVLVVAGSAGAFASFLQDVT
jgi:voltage-gated potassium channel